MRFGMGGVEVPLGEPVGGCAGVDVRVGCIGEEGKGKEGGEKGGCLGYGEHFRFFFKLEYK
jgi:hypothetical protein